MKKVSLIFIFIILLSSISLAQTYTEILEHGWGDVSNTSRPAFADLDHDGLLDLIVGEFMGNLTHYEQEEMNSIHFIRLPDIFGKGEIGKFTAPCFTDLDHDDLLDLIVGTQGGFLVHFEQNTTNATEFTLISEKFNNIDVGGGATPAFTDLDNNGLLDLFIGENTGNINHYQQDSENSYNFSLISENFAGIARDVWTAPTFTQLSNDGLLDMIVGLGSDNIVHYKQDAVGSSDFSLVTENFNEISLSSGHGGPVFTDINGNGRLDLIIGDQDGFLHHYEQSSENSADFDWVTGKFITGMIDIGHSADPCFADLDEDGLLDMIVGEYVGRLNHYEQDSPGSDKFNLLTEDLLGMDLGVYESPTITDMGNNDLLDLIVGNFGGTLYYFEQSETGSNEFTFITNNFNEIDVGQAAEPAFTDLDGDNLLDMIIGENDGNLNHYEQDAVGSTVFNLVTDSLSDIVIERWIRPCFTDLENDGLLDLIIGRYGEGDLYHYKQNSPGSSDFTLITENFQEISVGYKSRPIFTDINNDGLEDLLVGANDGGIRYYQRMKDTFFEEGHVSGFQPQAFTLYQNHPNPFNPVTSIQYDLSEPARIHISIYNNLGQMIRLLKKGTQQAGSYTVQWYGQDDQNNALPSGIYICRMQAGDMRKSIKLLLLK